MLGRWELDIRKLPIRCQCPQAPAIGGAHVYPASWPFAARCTGGPGTETKRILKRFGIEAGAGCECNKHAARMDYMGSDWCEANRDTIVDWLAAEAKERRLLKYAFSGAIARRIIDAAVRASRRNHADLPAIELRNLLFHCYPATANDIWRDNVRQLRRRWDVFNGRRVVAVAIGDGTHDAAEVARELEGLAVELVPYQNDPQLRETATFPHLLAAVQSTDPAEATFYCHSKGNTCLESGDGFMPDEDRLRGAIRWRNAMYSNLLDRADECMARLESYFATGTTQMICPEGMTFMFPSGLPMRTWMFAGTFFWFRHDALFTHPHWARIPSDRYGAEAWLGGLFRPADACSMLQPWPADSLPAGSPYNPAYYSEEFDE